MGICCPAVPFVIMFLFSLAVLSSFTKNIICAISGIIVLIASALFSYAFEETAASNKNSQIRRDYVATVISSGGGMGKEAFVNGISMTHLTPVTKFMAHMPLAFHSDRSRSALPICFGMGRHIDLF